MSGSIAGASVTTVGRSSSARKTAHDLLDELLNQLTDQGFFGVGTLELGSQNG